MTVNNYKSLYSRFLKGHEDQLHFAAHSHHFWPDISRNAQIEYWDDCAQLSDEKWGKIFNEVIPRAQDHVAQILNLKNPKQIVFAPNTHELSVRLLSLFLGRSSLRILTSGSEFHSWRRQFLRLSELSSIKVHTVSAENFLTDRRGFINNLKSELKKSPDIFFISQVFFDSGLALTDQELIELEKAKNKDTIMVVDGYHGFAALPSDLSSLEGKIFYLGGGYKYAQAGEGMGFMVIPQGQWRPAYTGWFAEYAELNRPPGHQVGYSADYMAFMGATQDPSGLYRFNAIWNQFKGMSLDVPAIHSHVLELQRAFLLGLPDSFRIRWQLSEMFDRSLHWHGHFLTFKAPTEEVAQSCQENLKEAKILIDRRGTNLRFGFGLYQDLSDVENLLQRIEAL